MTDATAGLVRLYSVTTILNALPKEALRYWAVGVAAKYAVEKRKVWGPLADDDPAKAIKLIKDSQWETTKKASIRGTDLHRYAEDYVKGKPVPEVEDPAHQPYADAWLDFLRDFSPVFHLAEATVYSRRYSFAGTLDAIVEIGGRLFLLDYKTTDKLEGGPPYPDTALQLAAYANADMLEPDEAKRVQINGRRYYNFDPAREYPEMPKVEAGLILVVRPGSYNLVPVRIDEEVFRAFLHVREVFRWQVETSKRVLGPELRPINEQKEQ